MAIYDIVKVGAPILREKAVPVTRFDKKLARLLKDMAETMYAANGCGLAAPRSASANGWWSSMPETVPASGNS